jgi:Fur family ferric uptake transcriptional regulator
MENTKQILAKLKEKGRRFTKVRKSILDCLLAGGKPVTVAEIQQEIAGKGVKANKTTLYRQLELLKEERVVRELRLAGQVRRYEIAHSRNHAHLVCLNCHGTQCIELGAMPMPQAEGSEKMRKFKVIDQSVEFFGLCSNCQ